MSIWNSVISAGASLLGLGHNAAATAAYNNLNAQVDRERIQAERDMNEANIAFQREANEQNIALTRETNAQNEALMREGWARDDTAVQRKAADMEAAGMSKTLAAGGSAASSSPVRLESPGVQAPQQGSAAAPKNTKERFMLDTMNLMQMAQNFATNARADRALDLQAQKLNSEIEMNKAQIANITEDTLTKTFSRMFDADTFDDRKRKISIGNLLLEQQLKNAQASFDYVNAGKEYRDLLMDRIRKDIDSYDIRLAMDFGRQAFGSMSSIMLH